MSPRFLAACACVATTAWASIAHAAVEDGERSSPKDRAQTARADEQGEPAPFRVGALAALGFPRPLAIEGMVKVQDVVGFGLEYSAMPNVTLGDADTKAWSLAGDVRLFPFRGIFFVGARAGYQHIDASGTFNVAPVGSIAETASMDVWYVNPRIGFLWTARWGFSIGMDVGVQVPLTSSFSSSLPTSITQSQTGTSVTSTLGGVLPTLDLIQIGLVL